MALVTEAASGMGLAAKSFAESAPSVVLTDVNSKAAEKAAQDLKDKRYEIIVNTKGMLLWNDDAGSKKPYLIITSEQVSKEYRNYLDKRHISWIACGKEKIDLVKAMGILAEEFSVERLGIVGGPMLNSAFLEAGLLEWCGLAALSCVMAGA